MTNQEMQIYAELRHEALEEIKRRGESFRNEVRHMISDIGEQETKRLTSMYESTLL